jgi:hypothetical protein
MKNDSLQDSKAVDETLPATAKRPKTFWQTRVAKVLIGGMVAIGAAILAPTSAKAGVLDSINKFNNNFFGKLATISGNLAKDITNYTGISVADVQDFLGVRNQIDPQELAKKIANSQIGDANSVGKNNTMEISRAINSSLSKQIFGKESQENFEEAQRVNKELSNNANDLAATNVADAKQAQASQSSQDILKIVSYQLSDIMQANASLIQMNTSKSISDQQVQFQLAALNQNAADSSEHQLGADQATFLRQMRKEKGMNQKFISDMTADDRYK